jgi:hypothetical protein
VGDPGLKRLVGTAPLPPASSGRRLPQTPGACGPRGTTHDPVDRPFGAPRPRSRALPIGRCSEDRRANTQRMIRGTPSPRAFDSTTPWTPCPCSYRRSTALDRCRSPGQPAHHLDASRVHSGRIVGRRARRRAGRGSRPRPRLVLRLPNQDRDVRRPLRTRLPLQEARQRGARASGDVLRQASGSLNRRSIGRTREEGRAKTCPVSPADGRWRRSG